MTENTAVIARELNLSPALVRATGDLLSGGATVPFIARYRKEVTGSMDEVAIAAIRDRMSQLAELDKRRGSMVTSLKERDLLTPDLEKKLRGARTLTLIEDIYLPFRVKRRSRATVAREKGLEGLAKLLMRQSGQPVDVRPFVGARAGVTDQEEALSGARDIIADEVSEDLGARTELRQLFENRATLTSSVVRKRIDEAAKFRDYFEWAEPLHRAPSHRLLAILRGVNEGVLTMKARPEEEEALVRLNKRFLRGRGFATDQIEAAVQDSYRRLLLPALEREALKAAKKRADEEAVRVFVTNLRELMMAAPLRKTRVLAIDPGFRTGCKVVVLDAQGSLLEHTTVFPTIGKTQQEQAAVTLRKLHKKHNIQAVAIGNGTAGRETETFFKDLELNTPIIMVDESGASIYSASEIARDEFPDKDVTVRGAVSIGRRLQDPLAELVKIDPKSIGVGQYQHDVDQRALKTALDDTVMSCVNAVGVDLNSASAPLLTYVAGLGPQLAANVVMWRNENGAFRKSQDLKKVPRLGAKAFEQAAGFLRITEGPNPLDASGVHPERYGLVERMAKDQRCSVADLLSDASKREAIDLQRYLGDGIGRPTLDDIMKELAQPGRDPRAEFEAFSFADVHSMKDLHPGMVLPGLVTNVTAFGAFVDVGVHQDGLVHISQLANTYVKDPNTVVRVRQQVFVRVVNVDLERSRIGLSMRDVETPKR